MVYTFALLLTLAMIGETYPFLSKIYVPASDTLFYTFLSVGNEMVIPKAIAYTPIAKSGKKYYNLGFGDLILDPVTGTYVIDDMAESNNGDVKRIFYTVLSTVTDFFNQHPKAIIHIQGSNTQRMMVYNGLITRHLNQLEPFYDIQGFKNGHLEQFRSGISYEYVLISRGKMLI